MTDEQRAALRALAAAATPGPWAVEQTELNISPDVMTGEFVVASTITSDMAKQQDKLNATYIAAAHPAAVLALLDDVERLREAFKSRLDDAARMAGKMGAALHTARADALREAAALAMAEPEPESPMPDHLDHHPKERLVRAAVISTKRNISNAILALIPTGGNDAV